MFIEVTINGQSCQVDTADVAALSSDLGTFVGAGVSSLEIVRSQVGSRSQGDHFWIVVVDGLRQVALKRCAGDRDFLAREVVVAKMRDIFGLPHYKLERREGLLLRWNGQNCAPLTGWETTPFALIDFGVMGRRPNLDQLRVDQVADKTRFYRQLGEWAAFNILTCAVDRHLKNFVYDLDSATLFSVDNEDLGTVLENDFGNYAAIAVRFWVGETEATRNALVQSFREGFLDRWDAMVRNIGVLDGLPPDRNVDCARQRFLLNPSLILQRLVL